MVTWYGTDGAPIDASKANTLLGDILSRRVAYTTMFTTDGEITVSTVFLVLDHSHGGPGPVLWETLVGGGPMDQDMSRYTSIEAAADGHMETLSLIRSALDVANTELLLENTIRGPIWPYPLEGN
jgi:hypothetical protein